MTDLIERLRARAKQHGGDWLLNEAAAALEAARADKSDLKAALESLKAHKENATRNQDGIIKALSEVRDEQGAEIDALRSRLEDTVRDSTNKIEALWTELEIAEDQAEFYRTTRNWNQRKAERLTEALREKVRDWTSDIDPREGDRMMAGWNGALEKCVHEVEALLHTAAQPQGDLS